MPRPLKNPSPPDPTQAPLIRFDGYRLLDVAPGRRYIAVAESRVAVEGARPPPRFRFEGYDPLATWREQRRVRGTDAIAPYEYLIEIGRLTGDAMERRALRFVASWGHLGLGRIRSEDPRSLFYPTLATAQIRDDLPDEVSEDYAEPVSLIHRAGIELAAGLRSMTEDPEPGEFPLNLWMETVSPQFTKHRGEFVHTWSARTLLGALAVLAIEDLKGGIRTTSCMWCGALLTTANVQQKFCTPAHKHRADVWKARYRAKHGGADPPDELWVGRGSQRGKP